MGQRHQYIVIFPGMSIGKDGVNNRDAHIRVVHHQWLYGYNAILCLDRVLTLVKNVVADQSDYYFGTSKDGYMNGQGIQAIAATMSVDPARGYFHQVHILDEQYKMGDLYPDALDNNDGVTVIEFEPGKDTPRVCFATPSHIEAKNYKENEYGPFSPEQYLNFYYSKAERVEWTADKDMAPVASEVNAALARIEMNSRKMPKARLKKILKCWNF